MKYPIHQQDEPTRQALLALGEVFRELRWSRGLTQRKYAQRTGLSQSTISRLENGQAPWLSIVWVARLLAGLDLEPGLLGFNERLVESEEPAWARMMQRFERRRREAELDAMRLDMERRRQRAMADYAKEMQRALEGS